MEIVLQWLDDLDDLIYATALSWRSLCRCGLALGFLSALVLTPVYGTDLRIQWVMMLSAVAIGSVFAWSIAALITMRRQASQVALAA